jgi:hypothetical protein
MRIVLVVLGHGQLDNNGQSPGKLLVAESVSKNPPPWKNLCARAAQGSQQQQVQCHQQHQPAARPLPLQLLALPLVLLPVRRLAGRVAVPGSYAAPALHSSPLGPTLIAHPQVAPSLPWRCCGVSSFGYPLTNTAAARAPALLAAGMHVLPGSVNQQESSRGCWCGIGMRWYCWYWHVRWCTGAALVQQFAAAGVGSSGHIPLHAAVGGRRLRSTCATCPGG